MKKSLAFLLASTMLSAALLAGCQKKEQAPLDFTEAATTEAVNGSETETTKNDPNGEVPTDEGYGILREATIYKIGSLNPQVYTQDYTSQQIKRCSLSLYSYFPTEDGTFVELIGEAASEEPIQMDDEGKVWNIKLRDGLVWENGDVINADDVMYTWKMILDPKLVNIRASNFAKDVIEIENAMAYFESKVDWDSVGLKKIDDLTLEMRTVNAHSQQEIMTHLAHEANCLINEEYYEKYMNADRTQTLYGTSQDKWISSGPFTVENWINDAQITYKKNPNYVFKDKIWLAGIDVKVVDDNNTQMQLFENGETDYIPLSTEGYLKYEEDPRILLAPWNSVRYITINSANPNQPILGSEKFRQALYYGVDRAGIASLTKQDATDGIVPSTHIIDVEKGIKYTDTDQAKANRGENYSYDPEKAKALFNEALAETGVDKVSLTMLYADTELMKTMSEYLEQSLPNVFGADKFELKLQAMPANQLSAYRNTWPTKPDVYELSWGGWISTDLMPWAAFKYWTTYYSNKNEPYFSEDFDEVFNAANFGAERFEDGKRLEYCAEMERMLLEPAVVVPVSQDIYKYLKSDRLELFMKNWANRVEYGWNYAKIVE